MRYQQYKNKMMKIRKVIDFFYRFRFVFAGVITAVIAGSIALDLSRGNITQTSDFKISYTYGEKVEGSGTAFMSKVTFEYRRKGEEEWSEEAPKYAGEYEARARSEGSHGYKYSEPYTFEIKPYVTAFAIKDEKINFGDDSPELTYNLLPGDHIEEDYVVEYADLTEKKTTAKLDVNSVRIVNSDNIDVTDCYEVTTEEKEIEFIPSPITFTFKEVDPYPFVGDVEHPYSCDDYTFEGNLYYGAQPVVSAGLSRWEVGSTVNSHNIAIKDAEGNDYTNNYQITKKENTIAVKKAQSLVISTSTLSKQYDGQPFDESGFTYSVSGLIDSVHEIYDVEFDHKDVVNYKDTLDKSRNNAPIQNTITYKLRDKITGQDLNPRDYYESVSVDPGTISITQVPVTIKTPDVFHYFDNKNVSGYKEGDPVDYTGNLVAGDFLKVVSDMEQKDPGDYTNAFECGVYHKNDLDEDVEVTDNYNISYDRGTISIEVRPIVIKFSGQTLPYNGYSQMVYDNSNQGQIVDGALPTGWTYSATVTNGGAPFTMKNVLANTQGYQADETNVEVTIWDENNVNMTNYYTIDHDPSDDNNNKCTVTFEFEKSYVTAVPLSINVSDFGSMDYNNKTFDQNYNLNDYVTSVGLMGEDQVKVTLSDADQKNIKNAQDSLYNIGLNISVIDPATNVSVGGNYDITYNRDEPINATLGINKKHIVVHTPNVEKIYDGNNSMPADKIKFTDVREADDITPITDLEVSFADKTYTGTSSTVSTCTYDCFSKEDLIISYNKTVVHDWSELNNYTIDLIEDGTFTIDKRPISIAQTSSTSDYIYYDGQNHGVFTGSNEIQYTHEQKDAGLLESLGHSLVFNNPQYKNTANEPYEGVLYGNGEADKVSYFGTDILDDEFNSVKDNYEINFTNDYIKVNIIKKKVTITSGSDKKVFDGEVFDIYKQYPAEEWIDLNSMNSSEFTWSISRFDENTGTYVNANLDTGDKIQVKKTKPSVLASSFNVGDHYNEFEWRIVNNNGDEVDRNYYDVTELYGTLSVKKLFIDVYCDNRTTEYNSANINYPNGADIFGSDISFVVTESSREQGAYLNYRQVNDEITPTKIIPFNKTAFESKYYVKAGLSKNYADNYYSVGAYILNVGFSIYDAETDMPYTETTNVQTSTTSLNYTHNVTKVRIELQSTFITSTMELRIMIGTVKGGDVLYFGTEKYTTQLGRRPRKWDTPFELSYVHIYRNDDPTDDVTDCYQIIM